MEKINSRYLNTDKGDKKQDYYEMIDKIQIEVSEKTVNDIFKRIYKNMIKNKFFKLYAR